MEDLSVVPDDLLRMVVEREPRFPMCSAECIIWKLEHKDCQGCMHFPKCRYFVLGMEIGIKRALKRLK